MVKSMVNSILMKISTFLNSNPFIKACFVIIALAIIFLLGTKVGNELNKF